MSKNDKDEVREWMETHPQEYAQFAARMNEQGIDGILKLGEEAFLSSPAFRTEIEKMVSAGRFEAASLGNPLDVRFRCQLLQGKRR